MRNLIKKLGGFARSHPRILLGYLFGSTVRNERHRGSDYDIALLLDGEPTFEDRIALISELMRILKTNDVDIVILNHAPPLLRYEVVSDGRLFFRKGEDAANKFEMMVYREFFDTQHLRDVQNALLKEELLGNSK